MKRPLHHILEVALGVSMLCLYYKNPDCSGYRALRETKTTSKMTSLTARDKANVLAFWSKVSSKADDIGMDAITR